MILENFPIYVWLIEAQKYYLHTVGTAALLCVREQVALHESGSPVCSTVLL